MRGLTVTAIVLYLAAAVVAALWLAPHVVATVESARHSGMFSIIEISYNPLAILLLFAGAASFACATALLLINRGLRKKESIECGVYTFILYLLVVPLLLPMLLHIAQGLYAKEVDLETVCGIDKIFIEHVLEHELKIRPVEISLASILSVKMYFMDESDVLYICKRARSLAENYSQYPLICLRYCGFNNKACLLECTHAYRVCRRAEVDLCTVEELGQCVELVRKCGSDTYCVRVLSALN